MASILGINPVAGVATTFKVRFPVDRDLPSRSLVQIHFPRGFLVQTDQISAKRNIDCEFEVLSIDKQPAKTVLTLGHPREEDAKGKQKPIPNVQMIASDATVSFILNKIQNPGWSGTTPDFRIAVIDPDITEEQEAESLAARQQALDDDQEVDESAVVRRTVIDLRCPGNSIQAGSLENCSIVLEKLKVKKVGSARISFECFNSVPGDGQIAITFDESFLKIDPHQVAVEEGIFGDVKVELHPDNDHCVIIKRAAPQIEAEADNVEEEQENEEPAKEAPTKKGKAASGKAASDNAAPESESQEEADDYDELVPKSHGGTKVVLQIDGICNPATPGQRSKGSLTDRIYQIETLTADGQVIDEERSVAASKFVTSVDLGILMNFVFPPKQQHPNSTGRLLVFGLYGPLDENGKLRGGRFGSHAVTDFEVANMVADVERQDLLSVFTDNKTMLYEEEEEIIRNLGDARDRLLTRFTREQVTDLLNSVELDEDGGASFHDLQKLILEIRDSRIQACKVMYPGLTGSKGVRTKSKKTSVKKPKQSGPKMYGGLKKYHDNEAFEVIFKLLHRNASKIVNPSDPNAEGTVSNVWLLRHEEPLPEGQIPWNNNCCLKGQGSNQLRMNLRAKAKGHNVRVTKKLTPAAAAAKAESLAAAAATKPWAYSTETPGRGRESLGAASVAKTTPWSSETRRRAPPSTAAKADTAERLQRASRTKPW